MCSRMLAAVATVRLRVPRYWGCGFYIGNTAGHLRCSAYAQAAGHGRRNARGDASTGGPVGQSRY